VLSEIILRRQTTGLAFIEKARKECDFQKANAGVVARYHCTLVPAEPGID
jgi:hypothetical protein